MAKKPTKPQFKSEIEVYKSGKSLAIRASSWELKGRDNFNEQTFEHHYTDAGVDYVLNIPVEFKEDFEKDPEIALRDFGAVATQSVRKFFTQPQAIADSKVLKTYTPLFLLDGTLNPSIKPVPGMKLHMHFDLSINRDRCGVAGGYKVGELVVFDKLMPVVDIVFAEGIEPKDHGGEINYAKLREMIRVLTLRGFVIETITFDQKESHDMKSQLEDQGYFTDRLSVDRTMSPYNALKELIYLTAGNALTKLIYLPHNPLLITELKELVVNTKGKSKVDHPSKFANGGRGSKDISDAVAAVVWSLMENIKEEVHEEIQEFQEFDL